MSREDYLRNVDRFMDEKDAENKRLKAENALLNDAINEDKILVAYAKELEAKLKIAVDDLEAIKNRVVVGDATPYWSDTFSTSTSRLFIANKADEALEKIKALI